MEETAGGEVVNNLFYSQYELLRAFILVLAQKHPSLALELLLPVIKAGGRIPGVLWSRSTPSASHLSWMCWAELSWLLEKSTGVDGPQKWMHAKTMSCAFESLLYLEEFRRWLRMASLCRTNCLEEPCPCSCRRSSLHSAHLHCQNMEREPAGCLCWSEENESSHSEAEEKLTRVPVGDCRRGMVSQAATEEMCSSAHDFSKEFCSRLVEDLYLETVLVLKQFWRCEHPELNAMPEDPAVVKQDHELSERDHYQLCADVGGAAEHTRNQNGNPLEDTKTCKSVRSMALLKKFILLSPELLSAFCKASARYRLRELEEIDLCAHYLLQTEVQSMHLQLIRQRVRNCELIRAAKQLRYLCDSGSLPPEDYRDVLKILFQKTYEDRRLRLDGKGKSTEMIICSEVLATGRVSLCLAAEETMLVEEAEKCQHASEIPVFSMFMRLHERLQTDMSDEASLASIAHVTEAAKTTYEREIFQYACTQVVHAYGEIINASLSLIEKLLFDQSADVLLPVVHLKPLVVVMGWDRLPQEFVLRQKMVGILLASWLRAGPVGEQAETEDGIHYASQMLQYQLELACFLASRSVYRNDSSQKWDSWCTSSSSDGQADPDHRDPFVANIVLEQLGSRSPIQVLFHLLPDINPEAALCFLRRRPIGLSRSSRKHDVELVHIFAGVGAAIAAICSLEEGGAPHEELSTERKYEVLLAKLQKHLERVCTPSRLFWMLDFILSLLHVELPGVDDNALHPKFKFSCSGSTLSTLGASCTKASPYESCFELLHHKFVAMVKRRMDPEIQSTMDGIGGEEATSCSVWAQKKTELARSVNNWEWHLKGLRYLVNSHSSWQRRHALNLIHGSPSIVMNLYLQHGHHDIARECLDRFDLPAEEVATFLLAEWIQKVEGIPKESSGSLKLERALEEIMRRVPSAAISGAIICLDCVIGSSSSFRPSRQLLNQVLQILVESDKKQSSPGRGFMFTVMKQLLNEIHLCLELSQAESLRVLLLLLDMNHELRHGPKPRALLLLRQVIGDASIGKRQFLNGKLHNIVKALADDEMDDSGTQPDRYFYYRRDGQIQIGSDGGHNGLGFAPMVGVIGDGAPSVGGSHQATEFLLHQLKRGGRRWLSFPSSKSTGFLSAFALYIATIGDVVDGVDTTHDFNFFSLIHESAKDVLRRLAFEQVSLDAAVKLAEVMRLELVQQVTSESLCKVYPPFAGKGWAFIFGTVSSTDAMMRKGMSTSQSQVDVLKSLLSVSPARAMLACLFGNRRLWLGRYPVLSQDQGQSVLELTVEQAEQYPILHRWVEMQQSLQDLFHVPNNYISEALGDMKASLKGYHPPPQDFSVCEMVQTVTMPFKDKLERNLAADLHVLGENHERSSLPGEAYPSSRKKVLNSCRLLFDWESQHPCAHAAWRLAGEGKLADALALADRWLCDGAPDSLLFSLVESREISFTEPDWQPHPNVQSSWVSSWQLCIRLRSKNLAAKLALRCYSHWELDAAVDVLTMCNCHLQPSDSGMKEVADKKTSLLLYRRILQADSDFRRWQEIEVFCRSDPEGLALRLAGKGAVCEALGVAESQKLSAELQVELRGRQLVKLFEANPADGGGPAAGFKFLLEHCENAFAIAMAALDQLPSLHFKQLLVQFISKHHTRRLSKEDQEQVNQMVLGLRILGALPVPWQHRCSMLHKHPKLIYETLLMWKQWHTALELQKAFPVLQDDALVIAYAAKAISVSMPANAEPRASKSAPSGKVIGLAIPTKSSVSSYLSSVRRESCQSLNCTCNESGKDFPCQNHSKVQKCDSKLPPSHRATWEAIAGPAELHGPGVIPDGSDRSVTLTLAEDWVLTGDLSRDETVRSSHRFESAPCPTLFKSLLFLCSHEVVAARAAVDLCIAQVKRVLGEEHLPISVSMEGTERAFSAAAAFATILQCAVLQLRKLVVEASVSCHVGSDALPVASSSKHVVETKENLTSLLQSARDWLGRIEVFQSFVESGVAASINDILNEASAVQLRDRLIAEEHYTMAIVTCENCKIDAFPAWKAWGHSLLRIGGYAQAREKLKQALALHIGDPAPTVWDIITAIEREPPGDMLASYELYLHMVKSVHCSSDDSLSADSYLNVLHVPLFEKTDKVVRWSFTNSSETVAEQVQVTKGESHVVRSNLDDIRFEECVLYMREFCRENLLAFSFQHGRYVEASQSIMHISGMSAPLLASLSQMQAAFPLQRPDLSRAGYGSIDELCDLFVGYAAIPVLVHILGECVSLLSDQDIYEQATPVLERICNFCEARRYFNHLYRFLLVKKDPVAAGLCGIQLFHMSLVQDEAVRHLGQAKVHFNEGLLARQHAAECAKIVSKTTSLRSPSEKVTEEELMKFTTRVSMQTDVVRSLSATEGRPWKYSLFGDPRDADTLRRRCESTEILLDRNFDLAFKIIYEYSLPRTQIYAGYAASLAARKKVHQLLELFRNIKGTIADDDLDQILGAAISVYAHRHRESPYGLIEMIGSSHRKVLALVACGRLRAAYQVACQSGIEADVQFVAQQAQLINAFGITDLCKQWLAGK